MLGLIFRGVFLIGILSWYSVNVWKLIDGYFKDQFDKYLQEEYRKDPHLKSDMRDSRSERLSEGLVTDSPLAPQHQQQQSVETSEPSPTDTTHKREHSLQIEQTEETDNTELCKCESEECKEGSGSVVVDASENGAESMDKNAFLEAAESGVESRKRDRMVFANSHEPINHDTVRKSDEVSNDQSAGQWANERRSTEQEKRSIASKTIAQRATKNRQQSRNRIPTVILTSKDFASVKDKQEGSVDDFWEFEEDPQERKQEIGIAVADLPFKPRADIGNLDRVSPEEYCPLTSEDEVTCGETVRWP